MNLKELITEIENQKAAIQSEIDYFRAQNEKPEREDFYGNNIKIKEKTYNLNFLNKISTALESLNSGEKN